MGSTVLVIGGAGRLGKGLALMLHERGHSVRVFDLPIMDFSGLEGIGVMTGDITVAQGILPTVEGVDAVVHLASLLPPRSETDPDAAWRISVEGTRNIINAILSTDPSIHLIYSSSVATYGDTMGQSPPIGIDQPQNPMDTYGRTKVAAEALIKESALPWTILRIAGIAVAEFLEPPEEWPFQREQRVEFIDRDDAALALAKCVGNLAVQGRVFNIGGGATWQMRGWQYVKGYYDIYELPLEEARFQESPGWIDWYDTEESQRLLDYQKTSWQDFLAQLARAVEEALSE